MVPHALLWIPFRSPLLGEIAVSSFSCQLPSYTCHRYALYMCLSLGLTLKLFSARRVLIAPMTQSRFRTRPILGLQHIRPFLSLCTATVSLIKFTHPGSLQNAVFETTHLMRNDGEGQVSNLTSMKETIPQPLYLLSYITDSE